MTMRANIPAMYALNCAKNMMFFGAVAVPFFTDWAGLDYTRMFLLEASFAFWMFALEVPTGVVADRYGRKYSLALGGLVSAASFTLFGLFTNYALFFAAEFVCAIGFTLLSGADRALFYDTLIALGEEPRATGYFSRYDIAGSAGIITGLLGGAWLAGSGIARYPGALPLTFLLSAAALLPVTALALLLKEPGRKKIDEKFIRQGINGFTLIFKKKRLRGFSLNYSFISAAGFLMFWLYQPLLKQSGVPITYNGVAGTAFNLLSIVLMMNIVGIQKRTGIRPLLMMTALIPGLLYIGLYFTESAFYTVPAMLFIVALKQMRAPLLSDLINRDIESANRATVLSGLSMLERVIIMFLYPVVGLLADRSIGAACLFLGASMVLFAFVSLPGAVPGASRSGGEEETA